MWWCLLNYCQCCWLKVFTVIKSQRMHGRQGGRRLREERRDLRLLCHYYFNLQVVLKNCEKYSHSPFHIAVKTWGRNMLLSFTVPHIWATPNEHGTSTAMYKCITTVFPQISKTMMHKAANEVGLLTVLNKKLIKWKFQVQVQILIRPTFYIICQVSALCATLWKIHYNL